MVVAEMSPYLLFGFFVAGILSVVIPKSFVLKHLGGKGFWPLLKASAFGVPLPLCSCGVIPVATSLRKQGASKGATIAFLISTPQTGVDSIMVTLSLLGPVFAIFRPVASLVTGFVGGLFVNMWTRDTQPEVLIEELINETVPKKRSLFGRFKSAMHHGFVTLPADISSAMLVGLIIAAAISVMVPEGFFAEKLGVGIIAMFVMMILGIPVYVCATASVPIAAALMLKGVSPGAALVFLMTGPATNAASLITIGKSLGKASAVIYLLTVAFGSIACGLILDWIMTVSEFSIGGTSHWMLPGFVKNISAVILFAVLFYSVLRRKRNS
jgi:hypothetical protein